MLAEHLFQDHDMASRSFKWVDRQVEWIHQQLLAGRAANILDVGCGPGFYSHRLASLGHSCRGIDFGPASIDYARQHNPEPSRCEFGLGDIRGVAFEGPYDLAMFLFGEMNAFSPLEMPAILARLHAALIPNRGTLILEIQTPELVEQTGRGEDIDEFLPFGLFSDRPYRCQTRCEWIPSQQVAIQTFTITDIAGATQVYRNTTKAWSPEQLKSMLQDAGFDQVSERGDWPSNLDGLRLVSAKAVTAR